jgi:hypothetical protein
MAKKSCEKHKKFNYYCEDCQAANIGKETRFNYNLFKGKGNYKRLLLLIIVVVAILASLGIFWWWPSWYGNINLQAQLYSNKAGGINFFDFYFLNLWSTNFIFNKTALIGAFIGSVIMSLPPERNLLTIIGTKLRFGKPSKLKALAFWWTIGFVMFYFLGLLLDVNSGGFSWTIYLIENGQIEIKPTIILDAFAVLFDSNNKDFITIFIYSNLILPVVTFIFGVLILRLVLNIVKNTYLRKNDYYVISNAFIIIGLLCGLGFFFVATLSLDGIGIIQIWTVILGFITMTSLGIFIYIYGKMQFEKDSANYIFSRIKQKKIIYVIVIVIAFTFTPLIFSIGPTINLNNTTVWTEQQWIKKYNREIEWTSVCAGLDMFEEQPISNFIASTTSEADLVNNKSIRVYDQSYAVQYLAAKIGSTYEGLADSDIVYINNTEYWVAPKTVKFSLITGDAVKTNTELYDHVEGFLAMDTFNGSIVPDVSEIFNISVDYPIFFGESESQRYLEQVLGYYEPGALGSYDSDILLNTGWEKGIKKNNFTYEGEPDGALTGLEGFWKTVNLGLLAYALQNDYEYLINRNVKNRIEQILLPQLRIDSDPYLVFDMAQGKMFYAVSIYTNIHVGSYAQYPILRFLGVSLVDVKSGEMTFYENPSLDPIGDPTYPLWEIYRTKYNWQTAPNWLLEQMRYPEELFELQLEANYLYHVQDPSTWRRGDDFHERPENGDLFYIESDLGNGIEFVGIDLVEYQGQTATLLAGMYVVRHGAHFGEAIFYHTRTSEENLIGPKTARDTYAAEATQKISLISNFRHGNTLLYPLGGSIYYFIPTYSASGDIQNLGLAGFVEAFTREVYYDFEVEDAAKKFLNISDDDITPNVSISYNFEMDTSMTYPNNPANFEITLQNYDTNFSAPELNVTVYLSVYTSTTLNVNYSLILPPGYPIENTTFVDGVYTGVNFTMIDTKLYFGQGLVLNGFLNTTKGNVIIYFEWTLIVDDVIIYESQTNSISVSE